jgi:hypothetical protein
MVSSRNVEILPVLLNFTCFTGRDTSANPGNAPLDAAPGAKVAAMSFFGKQRQAT